METAFIPDAQLEVRAAEQGHLIRVRVMPYGAVTTRADNGGRPERFRAHAFGNVAATDAKIRLVDENHAKNRRPVGLASAFADREDALYGDFRMYDTPEGRGALENVREGTYGGVSVGFVATDEVMVDGIREIRAAQLHHVSLVDTPAYADAEILEVRSAAEVYAWLRQRPAPLLLPADADDTPMIIRAQKMFARTGPRV